MSPFVEALFSEPPSGPCSYYAALALDAGQKIDSKLRFYGRFSELSGGPVLASINYGRVGGYWANMGNRYLAFRFFGKGQIHPFPEH